MEAVFITSTNPSKLELKRVEIPLIEGDQILLKVKGESFSLLQLLFNISLDKILTLQKRQNSCWRYFEE